MQLIINAIRDAAQNPALVPLLNQALTDRTTLLQSEIARVAQLQALLTAIQGGNKAAIQSAREALRTASETVEANMKTFREDCRAIREHMRR
jgi:predicted  nucleic acid-binding Zn-ribbon protein